MAIRPHQLVGGRSTRGTHHQCLYAGQIRVSTNNDVFYGMDGGDDFHSIFCPVSVSVGMGGSHVWRVVGSLSGTTLPCITRLQPLVIILPAKGLL